MNFEFRFLVSVPQCSTYIFDCFPIFVTDVTLHGQMMMCMAITGYQYVVMANLINLQYFCIAQ